MQLFIINLSNISVVNRFGKDIQQLLDYADVVLGKQKEILALGETCGLTVTPPTSMEVIKQTAS